MNIIIIIIFIIIFHHTFQWWRWKKRCSAVKPSPSSSSSSPFSSLQHHFIITLFLHYHITIIAKQCKVILRCHHHFTIHHPAQKSLHSSSSRCNTFFTNRIYLHCRHHHLRSGISFSPYHFIIIIAHHHSVITRPRTFHHHQIASRWCADITEAQGQQWCVSACETHHRVKPFHHTPRRCLVISH